MGYDAFISYSHSADGKLAPAVQDGLQRLARPWYRRRALRVFRDETGLSVNPHLWGSIQQALDASRFFVLLASPNAAASPWVDRELRHWLTTHDADTVLPVLTEGTLSWDSHRADFDPTFSTALPPALFGVFTEEPRHLDLRWAREETDLDLRHSRFRGQVAELAAPLHGRPKDDLESDDIRQHRRALRLAWGAGIALAALTVASVVLSMLAFTSAAQARENERKAITQQRRADAEADLARRRGKEVDAANVQLDQANDDLEATNGQLEKANSQLEDTNNDLSAQTVLTEEQRQQALRNAEEARKNANEAQANADEATQNANEASRQRDAANENLLQARFFEQTARNNEADAKRNAVQAKRNEADAKKNEARALRQEELTEQERVAGLARQLVLGSSAARQAGNIDRALLLALEAQNFATRAGGVEGLDVQQPLEDALAQDPALVGYLQGLDGSVSSVAISTDGELAAAGSAVTIDDNRVGIWRLSDHRLLARLDAPMSAGPIIAFTGPRSLVIGGAGAESLEAYSGSPDGQTWTRAWQWTPTSFGVLGEIASTGHGTLAVAAFAPPQEVRAHVVDGAGQETAVIEASPNSFAQHLAISPNGTRVALDDGPRPGDPPTTIGHIYGLDNTVVATLTSSSEPVPTVTHMQFGTDGAELAVLVAGTPPLHRFDAATGTETTTEPPGSWGATVPSYPIALSPTLDRVVQRYGTGSATDPAGDLLGVGFLSSGSFVGGLDAPLARPAGATLAGAPAFTPDGTQFVVAGGDGSIPVFLSPELAEPRLSAHVSLPRTHFAASGIALSPDGTVAVVLEQPAADQSVAMHVVPLTPTARRVDVLVPPQPTSPPAPAEQVTFGDSSDFFAVGYHDGAVELYGTTGSPLLQLSAPANHESCRWLLPTPLPSCQLAIAGTRDAAIVVEASAGHIHTWNIANGAVTAENDTGAPHDGVVTATVLAGNRLVIGTQVMASVPPVPAGSAETAEPPPPPTFETHTAHVYARTPAGWTRERELPLSLGTFVPMSLSHDGSRLTATGLEGPTLYDLEQGIPLWTTPQSLGLTYDAQGRTLFSIEPNGVTARAPDTGEVLRELPFPATPTYLMPVAITQRSERVIVLARTDQVVVDLGAFDLQLHSPDLLNASCTLAGRNLDPAEWRQYVGTVDERVRTCAAFP